MDVKTAFLCPELEENSLYDDAGGILRVPARSEARPEDA